MTLARRSLRWGYRGWLWATLAVVVASMVSPLGAATTERLVVNDWSGLAINGFDPVAYFTDGVAASGREEFEYAFAGAVWSFRNEGNRAAFKADPGVYMPSFGGYDPVGLARGVALPGDPRLWLLAEGQLYLFFNREAMEAFARDPEPVRSKAGDNWPAIRNALVP
jgi:YHS domain-containing protein